MDVTLRSCLVFAACCVFLIGVESADGNSTATPAFDALIKCKNDTCPEDEVCYVEISNNLRKLMCKCKDGNCGSARLAETWVSFNNTSVQGRSLKNSEVTIRCSSVGGSNPCWDCFLGPDGSTTCQCPEAIEGLDCEYVVSEGGSTPCPSLSCLNGGTCWRLPPSGLEVCSCRNGYHGDQCEFSACSRDPCMNGGTCNPHGTSDGSYTFSCTCPPSWTGQLCESPVHPIFPQSVCIPNKCAEGCQCKPSCKHEGGYFCYGNNGKVGKHCNLTAPNITCGADEIRIEVDEELVKDYTGGFGNVEVLASQAPTRWHPIAWPLNACHASKKGKKYVFVVPLPFSACGTKLYMSGAAGVTVASNTIWFNQYTANGLAYITIPVVNFTCHYQKQYSVITSISPELAPPRVIQVTGKYRGNVTMELCKVNDYCPLASCPQKYSLSNGAIYTVGEKLYLRIFPVAQGFQQVRLTQLFLSCSPQPTTLSPTSDVVLLTQSCIYGKPSGPYHAANYARYGNGVYCVSFRVVMLKYCPVFYIHAHLETCTTNCNEPYNRCQNSGRRRRSAGKDVQSAMQTYGPIIVLDGKDGVLASTVYPGDEEMEAFDKTLLNKGESGFDTESSKTTTLSTALSVLIAVAVILSVLIAYSWRFIGGSRKS